MKCGQRGGRTAERDINGGSEGQRDKFSPRLCALLSLCLSVFWLFIPLIANAQTGVITGRVVNEEGAGMPGVMVNLFPVAADSRRVQSGSRNRTATDEDGNFKFTGLAPRVYSVYAESTKGYTQRPVPANERQNGGYHRIGANITITMIKGGVITGRVTTETGEPVIGMQVHAAMTRDADGNPVRGGGGRSRFTDDRGVYRIYGLQPGTYVVFTHSRYFGPLASPYDHNAPVYHPSSTRETAAEVAVAAGSETVGVDIRYRSDPGYVVSGVVTGGGESSSPYSGISVMLTSVASGTPFISSNVVRSSDGTNGFSIYGVTDGEYEIAARRGGFNNDEDAFASAPRRIVVKGANVGGIELKLMPLGSISGKFALEAAPDACESKRNWSLEETLLTLRYEAKPAGPASARNLSVVRGLTEKGEFTVSNLEANRYFFEPRLPNERLYVKSITSPASTSSRAGGAASRPADVGQSGIALKAGEKVTGVTVTVADGAAALSGKVAPAKEGAALPARLRVHLVPAAPAAANDLLRYAEAFARSDGSFSFSNIAPGKYWLIARAAPDDEWIDIQYPPVAWDAAARAKLRKEAEAMKIEVELKPCQRVTDQVVKLSI